jgi:hypothetical protein
MGNTTISWPHQPSTLGAALLSAALIGALPEIADGATKELGHFDARWNAPNASLASSQGVIVSYGTISATSSAFGISALETDPWQELEQLEQDWDGQGADRISRDAIDHALTFMESLLPAGPAFEPFAHPKGYVGLEARKKSKSAFLLVSPTNRFAYVIRSGDSVHRGDDVDPAAIRELLALLY